MSLGVLRSFGGAGCSACRLVVSALVVCAAGLLPAQADAHEREIVPEFNAFIKLSDRTRLYLLGDLAVSKPQNDTEAGVGAHIDLTLMPLLRPHWREADWVRDRYLWARIGYQVIGSPDGGAAGPTERRALVELTGRVPLPEDTWLVSRARVDLRDLGGEFSHRVRFRVGVEREFSVAGVVLVPYAQAEASYDSRYDGWNRRLYQAGFEIELSKTWRIEPYVARQNDSQSPSANVDRFGLVLKYYR